MIEEEIGKILTKRGLKIATAESCSGGLIAHRITNIPGASNYFQAGFITYSNESKESLLSIPRNIIEDHGAVSAEVAKLMAERVKGVAGVDIGLAVTGIAGPTGGSPEKPVGTVFIGLSGEEGVFVRKFLFDGGRLEVKTQTAHEALLFLMRYLKGELS
jgi:nicotinamide-nucleotide amidase